MKTGLIIGAGSDIGRALAAELAVDHDITQISSRPGELAGWHQCDYSEAAIKRLAAEIDTAFDLMIVCNGFLHDDDYAPEKSLRDLSSAQLHASFERNTVVPALFLKHFGKHLKRRQRTVCVVLSAKVGSIGDNRTGGWYGYRASKAALNMIIRNAAIELGRTNRELVVAALHPGTTKSDLSSPFVSGDRGPQAVEPDVTAARLVAVIDGLGPEDSGGFFDWQGQRLPW
ncbi:MAG: SDR family NAD(P)-dependent oxidoreductase [Gammaproteobacteria bacterium]|nr:SDR family NAD(P)-dependent oxidoreductase [Gammaproteobacteria bacterium]